MFKNFHFAGISHSSSPIEIREKLALSESESEILFSRVQEVLDFEDLLILSTCNRTEFYYTSEEDRIEDILSLLCIEKNIAKGDVKEHFSELHGKEAVEHLFSVSLGLDAKVLGDLQIPNQVKRAYQLSADKDGSGPFMHRLMHSIFYANKRVVQETEFRDGAASTSYASVDLVRHFARNFKDPRVLVLGLGEIGKDVVDNMKNLDYDITISSRNFQKTVSKAEECGFKYLTLEDALAQVQDYEVIVSSLNVDSVIVTPDQFPKNVISHKLIIDLSVPRSISPDIENIPGIALYNIDQIEEKTSSILEKRQRSIPEVKAIRNESIEDLKDWAQEMEVSPTIKKLKQALENIRKDEVARFVRKHDAPDEELIDKLTKNIIQKVIKLPVIQLKAACKRGEADSLVDVLIDLFDLEKDAVDSQKS